MLPPLITTEASTIKLIFFVLTLYWLGMAFYLGVGLSHYVERRFQFLQGRSAILRDWYYPLGFCMAGYAAFCLAGWLVLNFLHISFIGNAILSWPGIVLYLLQVATVSWLGPVGVIVAGSLLVSCILMAFNRSRWALILLATGMWLSIGLLYPVNPLSRDEVRHEAFGEPFPYYIQPHPELLQPCIENCDQNYPLVVKFHAFSGTQTSVEWGNLALSYSFMLSVMTMLLWGIPSLFSRMYLLFPKWRLPSFKDRVPHFNFKQP